MSAADPGETTVAAAVGAALAAAGVRVVFGVLGSGNLVVTNALTDGGARFVAARHEGGAATMADGYARVSGEVGVVSVHQGPGLTNAMTGIAEAVKSRTPLLVLAADTPAAALTSNFRIDQDGLAASVGAIAERVHGPATAVADALRALRRAVLERLPVVLSLPLDLQAAPATAAAPTPGSGALGVDITHRSPLVGAARAAATDRVLRNAERAAGDAEGLPAGALVAVPAADAIARAAAMLAAAERPVVVAGRGAVLADAGPALQALAERAGALLATSAPANGLFAGDPFALGIAGGFASPLAQELLPHCDLVLAVGATLNHWTTRHGTLFGGAPVVQVDLDPAAQREPHGPRALVLPGDARATAELLAAALAHAAPPAAAPRDEASEPVPATGWRTHETAALIASRRWRDEPAEAAIAHEVTALARAAREAALARAGEGADAAAPDPGPFADPAALTKRLDEILPRDRTVAVDSGHFLGWPAMFLGVEEARAWVFPNGFQAVGLGLGCAIGAALARPQQITVAALGDGGCFMALPEVETAARLGLKLLVVVYDDAAYGAEVHHFAPSGHAVAGAQFPAADLAALGRAAGAQAVTVRDAHDLGAVERWVADGAPGPLVVDAKVDPTLCAAWLEDAFKGG